MRFSGQKLLGVSIVVQQSQAEKNRVGNYKHGGVMYIYVDRASPQGNVYVKSPNMGTAVATVNALHGRWIAGENFSQYDCNIKDRGCFYVKSILCVGVISM